MNGIEVWNMDDIKDGDLATGILLDEYTCQTYHQVIEGIYRLGYSVSDNVSR